MHSSIAKMVLKFIVLSFALSSAIGSDLVKNNSSSLRSASLAENDVDILKEPDENGSPDLTVSSKYDPGRSGCSARPPALSPTLHQILTILLEFLSHTSEPDKANQVLTLIHKYMETVPFTQDKLELLLRLATVSRQILNPSRRPNNRANEYFNYQNDEVAKPSIVFRNGVPGLDEPLCRNAFSKLVQTALDVYREVAKQPQCQSNNWQNVFVSNVLVQPEKPFEFEIIIPEGNPSQPPLIPTQPMKQFDYFDLLKYFVDNPNRSPPNTGDLINPQKIALNPNDIFNPYHRSENDIYNPIDLLNPTKHKPIDPPDAINLIPDSNNANNILYPQRFDISENPVNTLPQNLVDILLNLQKPTSQPLTFDVIVKLLPFLQEQGQNKSGINPTLLQLLLKYLHPDENKQYISDVLTPTKESSQPDSPDLAALLKYLIMSGVLPDAEKPEYGRLLDILKNNLQLWPTVSNQNKLPYSPDAVGFIELTYILKRPKPLIYHPVYYVKYRLPYKTFMQKLVDLVHSRPELREQPNKLYQELLALSNVTLISPEMNGYGKEDVLKLVFGNGAIIDAKFVNEPSNNFLNEQLELIKNLNSNVNPEMLGLSALNLLATSATKPALKQNDVNAEVFTNQPVNGGNILKELLGLTSLDKPADNINTGNDNVSGKLLYIAPKLGSPIQPSLNVESEYKNADKQSNDNEVPSPTYDIVNKQATNKLSGYPSLLQQAVYSPQYTSSLVPAPNDSFAYSVNSQVVSSAANNGNPKTNVGSLGEYKTLEKLVLNSLPGFKSPNQPAVNSVVGPAKLFDKYQQGYSILNQPGTNNLPGSSKKVANNVVQYNSPYIVPDFNPSGYNVLKPQVSNNLLAYNSLKPQLSNNLPVYNGLRPQVSNHLLGYNSLNPQVSNHLLGYNSLNPQVSNNLLGYNSLKPQLSNNVPAYNGLRPQVSNNLPVYNGLIPQVNNNLPVYNSLKPQVGNNLPGYYSVAKVSTSNVLENRNPNQLVLNNQPSHFVPVLQSDSNLLKHKSLDKSVVNNLQGYSTLNQGTVNLPNVLKTQSFSLPGNAVKNVGGYYSISQGPFQYVPYVGAAPQGTVATGKVPLNLSANSATTTQEPPKATNVLPVDPNAFHLPASSNLRESTQDLEYPEEDFLATAGTSDDVKET